MKNISRKCGLSALVVLLCLGMMAGVGLGTPGGPPPPDCPPCDNCTHCGGAAANWQCVTNCTLCQHGCPCEYACDDDPFDPNGCWRCDLAHGCVSECDYWGECEDCNSLVPGGQCQRWCDPDNDCCHGRCCDHVQCLKCNGDPDNPECESRCDPNEVCCYGKCCNTKQCLECNGDPNNPQCRDRCALNPAECLECDGHGNCVSKCDPNDETCCYGTCCNTKQCLECNGDPNNPQCRSTCNPNDECCYGTCCNHDQCLECNGDPDNPQCRSKCDPNDCLQCDGHGHCKDQCTLDPNACLKCDGEGECICDAEINSIGVSEEYVCVNGSVTFTADVDSRCDCVEWSGGGDPATASGSCSFTTKWATAGVKTVEAESPCSNGAKSVTVVEVGVIEINYTAGSWDDVTGETIVVLMGTKYTFRAKPNPTGASWPSGSPVWSGAASGTGATIEVTFGSEGAKTLTVKCGCCENGKNVTITVVKPQPDEVSFVDNNPGEEHDIYNVADPVWKRVNNPDNPVSYTMNVKVKMQAKFWAVSNLTYATPVHIDVETTGGASWAANTGMTFGGWPSELSTHVSDACIWNCIYGSTNDATWQYKVPSGTNSWIVMNPNSGPHIWYGVFGAPTCGAANYTKDNIDEAVFKAIGKTTEAEIASEANDNVGDLVDANCICNSGFQINFDVAMGRYPSGDRGMCCCRAEGLKCVLSVLGIGPYTHDFVNEKPEPNPSRLRPPDQYCSACDKVCQRKYWDSFWNNWEGVVKAGGTGSNCYAPANGAISIDEGTYSQIDGKIATDCGYYWKYGPTVSDTCPHLSAP
jgi:hypothetical protein